MTLSDEPTRRQTPGSLPDANQASVNDPPAMTDTRHPTTIRLVIELTGDQDPIEGELIKPEPHASHFRGWLALTALIETVRKRHETQPGSTEE
jgi:hypothetical protein